MVLAALGFASGAFWGVIALYVHDTLGLGPTGFGVILAVGAVGALIGSQVAPWVRARLGVGGAMYSAAALIVLSMAGLAITGSGVVAAALLVVNGVGVLVWNVVGVSLRQRVVPDELLGRVGSAFSVAAVGSATVGALVAGVVANHLNLPAVFWMSAAVIAVAAAATAPALATRRAPAAS
ncbi:Transmembrane secretion effector [Quadrisphaera granulorum]|uniref:Transmembrane secretion effector n=1 Tax=Quadrisphaera granulorum TaxID=317664 RepID=A0A315ZRE4_9ACTN|nr:MFS transporter [Quadrisphaera granulorum]PWJ47580.1 transmembrane secretion effector [Quadrisphaera granulorum]SZE98710.1 Transmembrane secretion effector [Quadrisphaera granulorum]